MNNKFNRHQDCSLQLGRLPFSAQEESDIFVPMVVVERTELWEAWCQVSLASFVCQHPTYSLTWQHQWMQVIFSSTIWTSPWTPHTPPFLWASHQAMKCASVNKFQMWNKEIKNIEERQDVKNEQNTWDCYGWREQKQTFEAGTMNIGNQRASWVMV